MPVVLNSGNFLPTVAWGTSQNVSVSGSSTQSSAVGAGTRLVRLASTTACHIAIGSNPTATSTSALVFANVPEYVQCSPGDKIAVIQDSASGTLNIVEAIL
ncbi:MAG: hypothetical protein AB7F19_07775 [Candidatus Babeliales bacterium]